MTENDINKLALNQLYEFRLYNGISMVGYFEDNLDFSNRKYYIVEPSSENRNKPLHEKGKLVKLEQIYSWAPLNNNYNNNAAPIDCVSFNNSQKSKKAIILGAGASYDFTYDLNIGASKRMPLTKDLFSDNYKDILNNYTGALFLSSEILLQNDLENYFQNQWKKIATTFDQPLLSKLISTQYYLHDLLTVLSKKNANNKKNNYNILVKLAHEYTKKNTNEFIPIISFNYDTLIEEAITKNGIGNFNSINDYVDIEGRNIPLFKPHGSCNWIRKFSKNLNPDYLKYEKKHVGLTASYIENQGINLSIINSDLNTSIEILKMEEDNEQTKQDPFKYNYYPSILIPYKEKDDLIMPYRHKTVMQYFLPQIDELLIIGWKGTEATFQKKLKNAVGNKKIKITLIDPDQDSVKKFRQEYSALLENVEFVSYDYFQNNTSSFTEFTKYCANNPDNNFFS